MYFTPSLTGSPSWSVSWLKTRAVPSLGVTKHTSSVHRKCRYIPVLHMRVYTYSTGQITTTGYPVYRDCHGICIHPIHVEIQFLLWFKVFNDFTAQCMSKLSCMLNCVLTKIPILYHVVSLFPLFFFLNSHNHRTNGHETLHLDGISSKPGSRPHVFLSLLLLECRYWLAPPTHY